MSAHLILLLHSGSRDMVSLLDTEVVSLVKPLILSNASLLCQPTHPVPEVTMGRTTTVDLTGNKAIMHT